MKGSDQSIIDKSHSEVSLLEHDTIENVSKPMKNQNFLKNFLRKNNFLTSFYATF